MSFGTILILIPLIAAVAACIAETKKKDQPFPRNLTFVGWVLIALAAISAGLNFLSDREKATAKAIRESLGLRQVETAMYLLMSPRVARSGEPPDPEDRFNVAGKYTDVDRFCDVELSSPVGYSFVDPAYDKATWAVFITERTQEGVTKLTNLQAVYGATLSDEINLSIGRTVSHPWNEYLMESKRFASSERPFDKEVLCTRQIGLRPLNKKLAGEYWSQLAELETQIGRRQCELHKKLGIYDAAPLFLRYHSTPIFEPDPKRMAAAMDTACAKLTSGKPEKPPE